MVTIHINTIPTLNIIRSIFEFKHPLEVLGYLYGKRKYYNGYINYFVENAQSAKNIRKRDGKTVKNTSRSHKALQLGTSIENVIGDYHSHTDSTFGLSYDDLEDMLNDPYQISLLIKVNKIIKKKRLEISADEVIGTICFDEEYFRLRIRGYYTYGKNKRRADLKFKKSVLKELFE